MAGQAGGYSLMGFTKKDAYNYIEKTKREKIVDGDGNAAIIYLEKKAVSDLMCMARYSLTDNNMLGTCFRLTVGAGLITNTLVMCNKKPLVIVTDGCDSMRAAIKAMFSEATHRLCAWHVEKNVTSNVKDEGLRQLFTRWLYSNMEIEEFEAGWDAAVEEYRLHDSFWVKETYDKRRMWANAYLKDKFCVGFCTTFRCEEINANVKKFLNLRHNVLELVQNVELMLILDVRREIKGVDTVNFAAKVRQSMIMVYTFKEYGIPGRQLMHEHAMEILSRLVLKRWRKDAKSLDNYSEGRVDE
ncbi:hypothetical protein Ahy_A07g036703 isoform A [Arachis hypogaea]|uniref:MULE transposase domain-containing protein n=1 Tax=Arachis hypogaea TaxID=3818 RepID=A0A445CGR9_ARAHY|nr:hypothetical protein Ahy_A07g036703 isoform A [Arachis hypogaea]